MHTPAGPHACPAQRPITLQSVSTLQDVHSANGSMSALLQRWVLGSQASRVQLSWSLHSVSLWQQSAIGWCTQPEDGSQKSCVHTSVSGGQESGVPGAQLPPWQSSAGWQMSPHGVPSPAFVYWHR